MATNFVKTNIVLRHDTGQNWETKNPVLLKGEAAVNIDNNLVKIGDGENPWKALPYINDISSAITAENIQTALGYTPVKDVTVAGTSVMTDGVVNVPIAQTWVSGEKQFGVMAPSISHGLYAADGLIQVYPAETGNINSRALDRPIVPRNLDYAVKAAMCDGKGAAWTADEQKAARERMGVLNTTDVTAETIQSALGYIPEKTLVSENYDGQIENLFPDKITVVVNNFWRYGNICQFVLQITVTETMTADYGVSIAKLPFPSAMRCWLNNATDYYIDSNGQYIRRNSETIPKGAFTLSGMYITNNATASTAEATTI